VAIGAEVVQVFTQSPRAWKPSQYAPAVLEQYQVAQSASSVEQTFCHATYLINLATPDLVLWEKSCACLEANLAVASGIGAEGLVLHLGSHRGGGLDEAVPRMVDGLRRAVDAVPAGCPVLIENAAGAGGTVGRSFEELAVVLDAADCGDRLGVCLDTQHLFASGIAFSDPAEADQVLSDLDGTIGLDRLACIHLNDSKVAFGTNRDRHENLGRGSIGAPALAALLGHPAVAEVPAILEVPGAGDGARAEDVATARTILAQGIALHDPGQQA